MATLDDLDRLLIHVVDTIGASEAHGSVTPAAAAHADDLRRLAQVVYWLVVWAKHSREGRV